LLGWDVGVVLYLVLVYSIDGHPSTSEISPRAAEDDEGARCTR
jgi:hypothetical protein